MQPRPDVPVAYYSYRCPVTNTDEEPAILYKYIARMLYAATSASHEYVGVTLLLRIVRRSRSGHQIR